MALADCGSRRFCDAAKALQDGLFAVFSQRQTDSISNPVRASMREKRHKM
jgi:hypothetical protein